MLMCTDYVLNVLLLGMLTRLDLVESQKFLFLFNENSIDRRMPKNPLCQYHVWLFIDHAVPTRL